MTELAIPTSFLTDPASVGKGFSVAERLSYVGESLRDSPNWEHE